MTQSKDLNLQKKQKTWHIQTNVLDKSVNRVPKTLPLSATFVHLSKETAFGTETFSEAKLILK